MCSVVCILSSPSGRIRDLRQPTGRVVCIRNRSSTAVLGLCHPVGCVICKLDATAVRRHNTADLNAVSLYGDLVTKSVDNCNEPTTGGEQGTKLVDRSIGKGGALGT